MKKKNEIVIYQTADQKIEVSLKEETVWLTQKAMAELFDVERSVVTKHIKNIFKSRELNENSVCAIFAHTAADGKKYKTIFYNLDVIISVGYRINSKKATQPFFTVRQIESQLYLNQIELHFTTAPPARAHCIYSPHNSIPLYHNDIS